VEDEKREQKEKEEAEKKENKTCRRGGIKYRSKREKINGKKG
jgi:hypothetical protein